MNFWWEVWASVIWETWKHRNDIRFNNIARDSNAVSDACRKLVTVSSI